MTRVPGTGHRPDGLDDMVALMTGGSGQWEYAGVECTSGRRWLTVRKHVAMVAASLAAVAAAVSMTAPAAHASPPPFGQLPVMGYNTWYQFGAGATESEVLQQAGYLVSSGLAAAGYDTVNLDDGWMAASRTSNGSLA